MNEDFELKCFDFGTQFFMAYEINPKEPWRLKANLLGWKKGGFILIDVPSEEEKPTQPYLGQDWQVRYLFEGKAFCFRTQVQKIIREPMELIFLNYPHEISMVPVRKHERYKTFLLGEIIFDKGKNEEFKTQVKIQDISMGGAQILCKNNLRKLQTVHLSFSLPNGELVKEIICEVKNVNSEKDTYIGGVRFEERDNPEASKLLALFAEMFKTKTIG